LLKNVRFKSVEHSKIIIERFYASTSLKRTIKSGKKLSALSVFLQVSLNQVVHAEVERAVFGIGLLLGLSTTAKVLSTDLAANAAVE